MMPWNKGKLGNTTTPRKSPGLRVQLRDEMQERINWLPLTQEETTDLLELLAEEIENSFEKEYEAYRSRLQAVYDKLLAEMEGKR